MENTYQVLNKHTLFMDLKHTHTHTHTHTHIWCKSFYFLHESVRLGLSSAIKWQTIGLIVSKIRQKSPPLYQQNYSLILICMDLLIFHVISSFWRAFFVYIAKVTGSKRPRFPFEEGGKVMIEIRGEVTLMRLWKKPVILHYKDRVTLYVLLETNYDVVRC